MAMQGEWGKEAEQYHRIVVMNTQGFSGALPIAYVDRIRGVAGIKAAVPYAWYGGNYKEEQYPFAQFGTDPKFVFNVWDEIRIDPATTQRMAKDPQWLCRRSTHGGEAWLEDRRTNSTSGNVLSRDPGLGSLRHV